MKQDTKDRMMHQIQANIVFAQGTDSETFHQGDLVLLKPYGLSMTGESLRPLLLFKDEAHQYTLPVAVSPIEAGVALSQDNKSALQSSPHKFTSMMFQSMGIELKQAVFTEIRGSYQYVNIYFTGHKEVNHLKLRADEAMSLCLYMNVPLYATKEFISKSRVMNAEMIQAAKEMQNLGVVHTHSKLHLH